MSLKQESSLMNINKDFEKMLLETFGESLKSKILSAYALEPVRGIRFNKEKFADNPFLGNKSELNDEIFIPSNYAQSVTHPLHHAGVYYIQDPSASTPVVALQLDESDIVLDMCAAPGGKSTYILNHIPKGFLISNDIDSKRNQKLVHNMDRWGHENVSVVNTDTSSIAKEWPSTFDKVLLDAPCSGEGLYRRDRAFASSYKFDTAYEFASLQKKLLEDAYSACKHLGIIVYSTCTLNAIENEGVLEDFFNNHPECYLEDTGLKGGNPGLNGLSRALRYVPDEHGEGHFIARIKVIKEKTEANQLIFKAFNKTSLELDKIIFEGCFKTVGEAVYGLKSRGFLKTKLPITRDGVLFGYKKKSHFEFDHALSQSVAFKNDFKQLELSLEDAYKYLYGYQIETAQRGLFCVTFKSHSLGFAKGNGNQANNRYPKGLRNKFLTYPQ